MLFIKKNLNVSFNSYIKAPRDLLRQPKYTNLSLAAKVLYILLLDRLSISLCKPDKWCDNDNNIMVFFKQSDLAKILGVSLSTVSKALNELEKHALIQRKKRYNNKTDIIYINGEPEWFIINNKDENVSEHNNDDGLSLALERERIMEQIEYEYLINNRPSNIEDIDMIVEMLMETQLSTRKTYMVNGVNYTKEQVWEKLSKINEDHIIYVLDTVKKNRTKVENPKSFFRTALFNAISTIDSYYKYDVDSNYLF